MLEAEAAYVCPTCAQTNYVGVDPSAGMRQRFTEDCPVCCRPIDFEVVFDADGDPLVVNAVNPDD